MFFFFSNRLGSAGSLLVTVVLLAVLFVMMRGCSGPSSVFRNLPHTSMRGGTAVTVSCWRSERRVRMGSASPHRLRAFATSEGPNEKEK